MRTRDDWRMFWKLIAVFIGGPILAVIFAAILFEFWGPRWQIELARDPVQGVVASSACGIWRWDVKTLTDSAANQVELVATPTTIEFLRSLPAPPNLTGTTPRQPRELKTYVVLARLQAAKQEADLDFHLVISGMSGATMIAEMPSPVCVGGAIGQSFLVSARTAFLQKFGQPPTTHYGKIPGTPRVQISGVAFFDEIHGQAGGAPNGIELHPVTEFQP